MTTSKTLPAFTTDERDKAHTLLAIRVAHMMGRKFEEGDWSYVYCKAKGIPETGWSNLNIDVAHEHLGVEHKMLCYRSDRDLSDTCGTTMMHPSATRSIRIPSLESDPDEAMKDILNQYADLIRERRNKVAEKNSNGLTPDMRIGWLLWQESLRQFMYFEEEMIEPDHSLYYAKWVERNTTKGGRKPSKNLWIFEKSTGRKRYSVTTSAGAKIQPYFDIPPPNDPNVYLFTVIGEQIDLGQIRIWLTSATTKELEQTIGCLESEKISDTILSVIDSIPAINSNGAKVEETGTSVLLSVDAYTALTDKFQGVSDEHCFRLLLDYMNG